MTAAGTARVPREHHRISASPLSLVEHVRELLQSRDLFVLLFKRELQVRYKQTALGVSWVALQPLVPALLFAVVFGNFARLPSGGTPYLLFALSGLVIYGLFSGAVSRAGASMIRDGNLVAKIYFPRALLPLASGSAALVDFLVGLAMVLVLMLVMGQVLTPAVVVLPVIVTLTLGLGLGLGVATSAMTAHYRDFGHLVPFVLQVLLYGSPVAYSMELLPVSFADFFALNPLVPLIEAFRWALLASPPPSLGQILIGSASGLTMIAASLLVFSRASRDLADVI